MSESKEKFFGTYFDRNTVLRISRAADIISWVTLTVYILNLDIHIGSFLCAILQWFVFCERERIIPVHIQLVLPLFATAATRYSLLFCLTRYFKGIIDFDGHGR